MKRKITALSLVILSLCSCGNTVQTAETTATTTTPETSATTTQTTTKTSAVSQTTTAETTTVTTITVAETTQPVDYSSFSLKKYYTQDENASPVSIGGMGGMLNGLYEDKMEIARQAVYKSEYYVEVVEQAKALFDYKDGVYTPKPEETAFYSSGYEGYFDADEPYKVNPILVYTLPAYFNSYREYVFVFSMPLPVSFAEWSGEDQFYVTVFVDHEDNAVIIPECCQQTLRSVEPIHTGRNVHLLFQSGHSQGTVRSTIISFGTDDYQVEYTGSAVSYTPQGANYILDDISVWSGYYQMLFYDEEKGYCEVKSEPLDGEAMDIICSSSDVLKAYPDIYDMCADGYVWVIGGKYITVGNMGTFSFENGVFKPFDGIICPSKQENSMNIIIYP